MAKWVRSGVLDNGLNDIKNTATKMLLISAYTAGDSYATVVAAQLAEATMTSGDYTLASSGSNRTLTTASGKSGTATATASGTPDLHIAFTDGSANVIWVTDETTNQPITSGNTINFPQIVYTSNQPT
jgi:hypothetical protein